MITARYMYTKGQSAHWYTVNISDLTAELLAYFQDRLARKPEYTRMDDKTIQWSTSSESAQVLVLLGTKQVKAKNGEMITVLDTASIKSEESRERSVDKWVAGFKAPTAISTNAATINPDSVQF